MLKLRKGQPDRRQSAAAPRGHKTRFRTLFDTVPVALFVTDASAVVQDYNVRATELWGRSPKRGDPNERFCGSLKLWRPDGSELPLPQSPIREVLRSGVPARNVEVAIERPDGTRVPVLVHFAALKNARGEITGAIISFDDVSPLKRVQEALRLSERRYAVLAETVPEFIWTTGPDGQVDYFNQRWYDYTGATPAQSLGAGWAQVLHPDDRERTLTEWRISVLNGAPVEIEYRLRAADDSHQWFLARASAQTDEAGGIVKWFGSCTNIHQQKAAQEALRRADRRKDEFLATLAHELRNPLAPIRNAVQMLQLQGLDSADAPWALDLIDRQTRQMARLMDDLLDVSRITRNQLEMRKQRVALAEVVRAATETSRPRIEEMRHTFDVTMPPGEIFLNGDLTRLSQALGNLLNNAAKYTDPGGYISLTVERDGAQVLLKVRDSGIGIAAPMLGQIFEMFSQVDGSLERTQGGLGIGLALAKRLIAMHGGSLSAHSEGSGKGCEFTVRLPVLETQTEAGDPEPAKAPSAGALKPRRILLVDDNHLAATSLSMLLKRDGHELRLAHDGEAAVTAAAEFKPEVVVLDIGLPKLNGYDAARKIRALPAGKDMLLIALTGWGQPEDRQRAHDAGFDHHLVKPADAATLTGLLGSRGE